MIQCSVCDPDITSDRTGPDVSQGFQHGGTYAEFALSWVTMELQVSMMADLQLNGMS